MKQIIFQLTLFCLTILFIHKKNTPIMSKVDEVIQGIADLQTSLDAKQAAIETAIKALQDQIAVGASPEQLQGIIDNLKAVQADVESTKTA